METDQHAHSHHQNDHVHSHGHDHSHETGHDHGSVEQLPGPSGAGSVVLDIGGDVGALALSTPDSLAGVEIEIRPVGTPWLGQHVAVRERVLPGRTVYAALFPSLTTGDYELRVRFGEPDDPTMVVSVTGGSVTRATWS